MFAHQLTLLMDALEVSAAGLAGYAETDRTGISRMKNGSRQPKQNGAAVRKLIRGIIIYCADTGKTEILRQLTGADSSSPNEMEQTLMKWLYKDSIPDQKEPGSSSGHISSHSFGTRLNAVMNLTGISNIRLSQLVYADASLISRYRSHQRRPKSGSDMAMRICRVLWERIEKAGRISELCELMMCPETDQERFSAWLLENSEPLHSEKITVESLISLFNQNISETQNAVFELPEFPESVIQETYYGTGGLRSAVLRFLKDAVKHHVHQMFLFSDENMDWLSGDPQFFRMWAVLMQMCIRNHTGITIIHYVNRNLKELNDAISGWLPLYLSGMISSYFCRKDEHSLFTNTMFLIPGMACIRSSHVKGSEADGIYHYHTGSRDLVQFEKEYRSLINQASPLFAILPGMYIPEGRNQVIIRNALPLAAMSQETVFGFHDADLYALWEAVRYHFDETEPESITEYIPLPASEQPYTESAPGRSPVLYTKEQYLQHAEDIRKLASEHPGYHPVFLKQCPFENVQIFITDTEIAVIRMIPSPITFKATHPRIRQAFLDYADRLQQSLMQDS